MGTPLQGDERELYRRHNDKLVTVMRRSFRLDDPEAGEVAQRAWLLFLEKQPHRETCSAGCTRPPGTKPSRVGGACAASRPSSK